MNDIKFINQENIYLNLVSGMTGKLFTKFPHIFFPKFELDKMQWNTYLKFTEYFLDMIMLNNTAFSTFDLSKNTSAKIDSMYKKYVSETEHDLKDFYDPVTKEIYTAKTNEQENEKKNKKTNLVFPNFGYEQYINTFSTSDRHDAFELLDSMSIVIRKMNNRVIVHLFIFFEEILRYISENSILLKENYNEKLCGEEKRNLLKKNFDESYKLIEKVYPKYPTFKKYALMIDQNCQIGNERGLFKFLRKGKYKDFSNTRNKIVHEGDKYEIEQPLTDFFYAIKEMLDYIYNKEEIIKKLDKVYEQVYISQF